MHRYRAKRLGALCAAIVLPVAGCSIPTSKENVAATAQLVAPQTAAPLLWRRDQAADQQARDSVEAMLVDGLTVEEAAAVAFLASPELQLSLEQLEISRSQLVAASTPPNPIGVIGSRSPGGNWAAFYPGHTLTLGLMQNVLGLLNIPERRGVAIRDLDRARFQAAEDCTRLAGRVVQAWLEYSSALQVEQVRSRSLAVVQTALDNLRQQPQEGEATPEDAANRLLNLGQQGNELFNAQNQLQRSTTEVDRCSWFCALNSSLPCCPRLSRRFAASSGVASPSCGCWRRLSNAVCTTASERLRTCSTCSAELYSSHACTTRPASRVQSSAAWKRARSRSRIATPRRSGMFSSPRTFCIRPSVSVWPG